MGRCKNNRHILAYPPANAFKPCGPYAPQGEPISLSLDEYESIRLLDYKGLQQTEAAEAMRISRPTLTRIYAEARRKIASAIVEGRPLDLSAGNLDFDSCKQRKNSPYV